MKILLVALIAGLCKAEVRVLGMTMISRPLVVATLVSLVYGDIQTGLMFGAQMELLSMGLVGIGAHSGMPEITLGSAICTAFICGNGVDPDLALTAPGGQQRIEPVDLSNSLIYRSLSRFAGCPNNHYSVHGKHLTLDGVITAIRTLSVSA